MVKKIYNLERNGVCYRRIVKNIIVGVRYCCVLKGYD